MIVIYTDPADGADRHLDADLLTCGEADAVSRAIDLPWSGMGQALRNKSPQAMRGIAWAWLKRETPTLRFSHFDPLLKSLTARFSTEEIPEFLDVVDRSPLTTEQRAQARAEVIANAMDPDTARKIIAEHDAPKEPEIPESDLSLSSGATTSS
jgi:hypothetical protein